MQYTGNAGGWCGANGGGGGSGNAPVNTDQYNAGAGANGVLVGIIGTSYFWGGGGGGSQFNGGKAGNGGKGGGGAGSGGQSTEGVGIGGTDGITFGQDGDPEGDGTPTSGNGGAGTGGGGGGSARTTFSPNPVSGSGGSGIVIIRYRVIPILASSSIELVRGSTGDANTDYKIINEGDFEVKKSVNNDVIDVSSINQTSAQMFVPGGISTNSSIISTGLITAKMVE